MRLVDVGLAALIARPPTISAGAALGAAALASMGVMAAVKKGKKKLWHDWNKSVLFVPHEDAVTHALKTLKGADRKKAEALVKELTPAGFLRAIHAMDRWIQHNPDRGEKYMDALDSDVLRKHLHTKLPVGAFRGITLPATDQLAKSKAGAVVTIKPFTRRGGYRQKRSLARGDTTSWTTDLATACSFAHPSHTPAPVHLGGKGKFTMRARRKPMAGVVLRCLPGGGARALLSAPGSMPDWFLRLVHATWARQRELERRGGAKKKGRLNPKKMGLMEADGLMSTWFGESEAIVKGPARAQVFAVMVPGKPTRTA